MILNFKQKKLKNDIVFQFFYLSLHPINQFSNKIMDDYPADNYDL